MTAPTTAMPSNPVPSKPVNVAILISGSGSNMEALIKSMQEDDHTDAHPGRPVLVISNKPNAGGLLRAENLGVKAHIIDHTIFKGRKAFERELDSVLRDHKIDLICCAGFMRVLTVWFTSRWPQQIINIHPSLLPKFKGLNTHERAIAAGETQHGASVHWVNEHLDGGDVIDQAMVNILPTDTAQTLQKRVLMVEHLLYIKCLKQIAKAHKHKK